MPVKRYCQTLDLKDAPELIAKYKEAHGAHVLLIRKDILLTTTNDPNQWGMAMCLTRGASLFFLPNNNDFGFRTNQKRTTFGNFCVTLHTFL